MMLRWREWLERLLGLSFVAAGLAKFFDIGEDTGATLARMAEANAGTEIAPLSDWLASNPLLSVYFAGVVMVATGMTQVLQLSLSKLAGVVQLAMIICFVTLMHRGFPIIFIDGFYVMALVQQRLRSKAWRASSDKTW